MKPFRERSTSTSESRSRTGGCFVKVMVDISEATFEGLAAQHEAHARLALVTQ